MKDGVLRMDYFFSDQKTLIEREKHDTLSHNHAHYIIKRVRVVATL
jgi:hypothetical protein